ncbi:MAG: UDP-3-O-(3-hydroxymyristoyl)glucosamine N-acyltransferase [Pseudomonadota bacterium]|jgi:UDP-3-O-[3-hydroxymyristoyl] glucosamine N-acyltransferase
MVQYNVNNFFVSKEKIKLLEILQFINCHNANELKQDEIINKITPLESSSQGDLTFFTKPVINSEKYIKLITESKAKFCLISKNHINFIPGHIQKIIVDNAYISFMQIVDKLTTQKAATTERQIANNANINKTAIIEQNVEIGENSFIDSCVKICQGAQIGKNVQIMHGCYIGQNCIIGDNTIIYPNCSIQFSIISQNCIIQPNANIGQDGFGFTMDYINKKHFKINHYGYVEIENDVEIGSCVCIDRGVFDKTFIDEGTKVGNHTQVAHNVQIGKHNVIVGKCAIGGSAKIGSYCMIGGNTAIIGHITIGNQCYVYGGSNVANSFPDNSKIFSGWPAENYSSWVRKIAMFNIMFSKKRSNNSQGSQKASFFAKLLNPIKLRLASHLLNNNFLKN